MNNKSTSKKSETNFEKLHSMTDEEIDFTDLPETTPEMWEKGVFRKATKVKNYSSEDSLHIDRDIIDFFKSQDFNYRAKINQLLREYMEAHQAK